MERRSESNNATTSDPDSIPVPINDAYSLSTLCPLILYTIKPVGGTPISGTSSSFN